MPKTRRVDRLARREEKATIKRIVYLSVFTVILAVLLFTFGASVLGKFTDLLSSVFGGKSDASKGAQVQVRPPILDTLPNATNSATLAVSGFADDGSKVSVFLDDNKAGETQTESGKFKFDDIKLKLGSNQIRAKEDKGGSTSDFSDSLTVVYDSTEPSLEVETPANDQSFSGDNRVKVTGGTDKDAQVYVNGFLASVNQDGHFEVLVPVSEGETNLEIKAVDEAGNTKVDHRKINFHK